MTEVLKQLVSHAGWQELKEIIKEETAKQDIDLNLTAEEIGKRYLAITMAKEILNRALNRAENIGTTLKERTTYR